MVVFLVVGAVVNVAVAWGCSAFLADVRDGWAMNSGATRLESGAMWANRRVERPGHLKIESHVSVPPAQWDSRWAAPRTLIEPWSRVPSETEGYSK